MTFPYREKEVALYVSQLWDLAPEPSTLRNVVKDGLVLHTPPPPFTLSYASKESEGFEIASASDGSISYKDEHHDFDELEDTSLQESHKVEVELSSLNLMVI